MSLEPKAESGRRDDVLQVDTRKPLTGFRVVEFGQYIAIPGAAQVLADQGATVIKVEPPGGEACRNLAGLGPAMFNAYNRGKRMVELDLAAGRGRDAALDLMRSADVVLCNLKPGALEKYDLAIDDVRMNHPRLIAVTLTGFGESGSMKTRPGLDIAAQAESGIMWVTGMADAEPQRVGFTVVDAATASVAAQAATAALLRRERTGQGAHIRMSLWDVALHLQATNWMDWFLTGTEPVRKGNGQPSAAPAADVFPVSDGYVVISAYMPHQWKALCMTLQRADLVDHPQLSTSTDRAENRELLHRELAAAMSGRSRDELVNGLGAAGVVIGSIRDYPDAFRARSEQPGDVFLRSHSASGPRHFVGTPLIWDGSRPEPREPRRLGEDNDLLARSSTDLWNLAGRPLTENEETR